MAITGVGLWTWIWVKKQFIATGSGLLIPMLKSKLASFDQSNNSGAIGVKIDGSVLVEK